jgi:hypothetical protein
VEEKGNLDAVEERQRLVGVRPSHDELAQEERRAGHSGKVLDHPHRVTEGAGDLHELVAAQGAPHDLLLVALAPHHRLVASHLGQHVEVDLFHLARLEHFLGLEDVEVGGGHAHLALPRGELELEVPGLVGVRLDAWPVVAPDEGARNSVPRTTRDDGANQLGGGSSCRVAVVDSAVAGAWARVGLGLEDEVVGVFDLHRRWGTVDLRG